MKRILRLVAAGVFVILLIGCSGEKKEAEKSLKDSKIVVLLPGEMGDLSWNDMNYEGILKCEREFGIQIECEFNVQESEFELMLAKYGDAGYDLVCTSGTQFNEAVNTIAPKYPETIFCIINGDKCERDNVALIRLKEYEASYLAAMIAGNVEEKGIIGMIGGYPNSAMERLLDVYEEYTRECLKARNIEYDSSLRAYTNSWSDKELGRKMAEQMIDSGVDTLFVYTNEAGLGCILAAEEKGANVIGFCSNPTEAYPDTVIASVKFNADKIYEYILQLYSSGELSGDNLSIGVKEGIFEPVYSEHISGEIQVKVSEEMEKFQKSGYSEQLFGD